MAINLLRLKKSEITFLASHRCKHGNTYLLHPHCYETERPQLQKLGFFDIETTSLSAPWGILICYAILDDETGKIITGSINAEDMKTRGVRDKNLIKKCVHDIQKFDKLITYNGKRFDIRFLRTRAAVWKIPFPAYGTIKHEDLFYIAQKRFDTGRKYPSLELALRTLTGSCHKTHHKPEEWLASIQGDPKALKYTLEHCKIDVKETKRLYDIIIGSARRTDGSI